LKAWYSPVSTDDNSDLWCRALSFLRTNKALKSLMVSLDHRVTESRVAAFRTDIAAMLQENSSLVNLSILCWDTIQAEEYVALVIAFRLNKTLKSLRFRKSTIQLTDDEDKQMAVFVKKNYALERLRDIDLVGDVGAILRLNKAGRRYLVQDGSSISKGVEVLSAVSNEINCVFLHLLENPRLCDRGAVEKVSAGESNSNLTVSSGGGKREQASLHTSRESRRRLE
jgi:hypothetical protein